MKILRALSFSLLLALLASAPILRADASDRGNDFAALRDFPDRVRKITLDNGMRFLLVPRPEIPTISFATFIKTGGLDDDPGKSGIAHMFEHMLFKGTRTIGTRDFKKEKPLLEKIDRAARAWDRLRRSGASQEKIDEAREALRALQKEHEKLIIDEEFWKIYEQAGAQGLNASTGYDYTSYTVSLPANRLELWIRMEAERLRNPVLREFYKERDVVLEERRLRIETNPRGKLWENFLATAFFAHPYGRPIIGWESEISFVTVDDAEAFFRQHYDVSRLVNVMVGGFDPAEAEALIRTHFGSLKSNPRVRDPHLIPDEPPQEGTRRVEVLFDAEPSLLIGFHRPDMNHPDNPAFEVLSDILSTGRTSRFYKTLVEKKKVAVSAWSGGSAPAERDPTLFVMGGNPRAPHTVADLEKALLEEIRRMQKDGPTEDEIRKVKNFSVDYIIRKMSSNGGLAFHLGYYEALTGDWRALFKLIEDIRAVTAEDVTRVARTYLNENNMTVGVIVKKEEEKK